MQCVKIAAHLCTVLVSNSEDGIICPQGYGCNSGKEALSTPASENKWFTDLFSRFSRLDDDKNCAE